MYPRFLTMCLRMTQFGKITHTQKYVVPFHSKKLFTTLRVNSHSFSGRIVPLFDTMLVQQGEGSGTPTELHHTTFPKAQSPSHTTHTSPTLPPVTTTSIPTVTPSDTPIVRQYTRRTRIAQSSVPLTVADEPASPLRDVSQGEACPTDSSFIADQDRATIDKSSALPHDSAPRITSPAAAQEVEINRLKERVKLLEDREGVAATRSGDDASIKGRSMNEGEAATERIGDESEEMVNVLTSMDAATILTSRVVDVPTGSRSIPTASTPTEEHVPTGSDVVPTASPVFATATVVTPYKRRKGKEVMVESKTLKKQRVQEQIDAHVARELEEQLERGSEKESVKKQKTSEEVPDEAMSPEEVLEEKGRLESTMEIGEGDSQQQTTYQLYDTCGVHHVTTKDKEIFMLVEKDYPLRKALALVMICYKLQVENYSQMANDLVLKIYKIASTPRQQDVEEKFNSVWKQMEDFIPIGSKEDTERINRKGLNLEQESAKKQKTLEEVSKEAMSPEEVPKEKVKEMMQLVPIEKVYVEALQVKHPIIDWKVYTISKPHR
nr:hypothetical protein [Tanacetum cinerariifolium]